MKKSGVRIFPTSIYFEPRLVQVGVTQVASEPSEKTKRPTWNESPCGVWVATQGWPCSPSTPPGVSGTKVPPGVYTTTTPLAQGGVPKEMRIALRLPILCLHLRSGYSLGGARRCHLRMSSVFGPHWEMNRITKDCPANSKSDSEKPQNMN